jgi:hypothetical protein
MRRSVRVAGPASAEAQWHAYAHTARWPTWAPHLRRVDPEAALAVGLSGRVVGLAGVTAHFEVSAVDEAAGTWSWTVTVGPVRVALDHAVGDGWTELTVAGPAPVVLGYLPVARLALGRLVRPDPPG